MNQDYLNLLGPMQTTKQQKKYLRENIGLHPIAWYGFSDYIYTELEKAIIAISTINTGIPNGGTAIQYNYGKLIWTSVESINLLAEDGSPLLLEDGSEILING